VNHFTIRKSKFAKKLKKRKNLFLLHTEIKRFKLYINNRNSGTVLKTGMILSRFVRNNRSKEDEMSFL